jgi:hypothetical protein
MQTAGDKVEAKKGPRQGGMHLLWKHVSMLTSRSASTVWKNMAQNSVELMLNLIVNAIPPKLHIHEANHDPQQLRRPRVLFDTRFKL